MAAVSVVTGWFGSGKSRLVAAACAADASVGAVRIRLAVETGLAERFEAYPQADAVQSQERLCPCCAPPSELAEEVSAALSALPRRPSRAVLETPALFDPSSLRLLGLTPSTLVCVLDGAAAASAYFVPGAAAYEQLAAASAVAVLAPDEACRARALALVAAVPPRLPSRKILSSLSDAVAEVVAGTGWRADLFPAGYFDDPFARHSPDLVAASLVRAAPLLPAEEASLRAWLGGLSFLRLKATLLRSRGGSTGGLAGSFGLLDEPFETEKFLFETSRVALIGELGKLPDSFALATALRSATGLRFQPTVLFSAPPPPVDTVAQRLVLASAGGVAAFVLAPWPELRAFVLAMLAVFWIISLLATRVARD